MPVKEALLGRRFGDYRITGLLGRGGMSTVYRARDENLRREVALKVLEIDGPNDSREAERFWREARLVAGLDHPQIVSIYSTGSADGYVYLAMELVEGEALRERLRARQGGLAIENVLDIGAQLFSALKAAHEQGVVHRDIKPENILVKEDGAVKVLDFGVAKRLQEGTALTQVNEVLGTVEYMAPEQILGEGIGPAADLYATGVVLYEMLTGVLPFPSDSPATLVYHQLNGEPSAPSFARPGVPRPLDRLVLRLLDKLPENRFTSAGEALLELEELRRRLLASSVPGVERDEELAAEEAELRRRDFQPRFTGRQVELQTLFSHFESIDSGGRVVFVSGEAGIGKSRLVERLERHALERGGRTIRGDCFFEHGSGAYMPFLAALGDLIGEGEERLDEEERQGVCAVLGESAPELAELIAGCATTGKIRSAFAAAFGAEEHPEAARQRLFDALFDLLAAVGARRPLLLVLEDMHWADDGSLQLLHYLVRRAAEIPLLCVATYRPEELAETEEEVAPLAAVMQQLHADGLLYEVRLERMEREALMRLVNSLFLEADFSDEFADFLCGQTQGNPLVAVEVVKLLRHQGILCCQGGVWSVRPELAEIEVPERINALIGRRINQLDDEHRELLQLAAVVGPQFTSEVLEAVADMRRIELLKMLFRLEKRFQLLRSTPAGYQFCHSKIREVLYAEISWELRREYHRLIADVLEERLEQGAEIDAEELGNHLYHGEEFARAVPHLRRSAEEAFQLFNWRRASILYERAAESCLRSGAGEELLIHALRYAGVASIYLTAYERALEHLGQMRDRAHAAGYREAEAEAWKLISKVHEQQRNFERAVDALEKSLASIEGLETPFVRGRVLINWGCVDFECGRYREAEGRWREALDCVEGEHPEEEALALNNLAVLATIRGELDAAWALYERALALYRQGLLSPQVTLTYYNMGMVRADQERWNEALELYERSLEICRESRYRFHEPVIELNRVEALLGKGDLVEGRQACSRALRGFRRLDDALGVADALRLYGRLCRLERNWEDGRAYLERSVELNRQFGESVSLGEALYEQGLLARDSGAEEEALAALHQAEAVFLRAEAAPDLERVRATIAGMAVAEVG